MGPLSTVLLLGSVVGLVVGYRNRDEKDQNILYTAFLGASLISVLAPMVSEKSFFAIASGQALNGTFISVVFAIFRLRPPRKSLIQDVGVPTFKMLQYLIFLLASSFGFAALGAWQSNCTGRCRGAVYLFGGDFVRTTWLLTVFLGGLLLFIAAMLTAVLIRRASSMR
jgi:hypothetical protein